jgi:hypothetical protein
MTCSNDVIQREESTLQSDVHNNLIQTPLPLSIKTSSSLELYVPPSSALPFYSFNQLPRPTITTMTPTTTMSNANSHQQSETKKSHGKFQLKSILCNSSTHKRTVDIVGATPITKKKKHVTFAKTILSPHSEAAETCEEKQLSIHSDGSFSNENNNTPATNYRFSKSNGIDASKQLEEAKENTDTNIPTSISERTTERPPPSTTSTSSAGAKTVRVCHIHLF